VLVYLVFVVAAEIVSASDGLLDLKSSEIVSSSGLATIVGDNGTSFTRDTSVLSTEPESEEISADKSNSELKAESTKIAQVNSPELRHSLLG
jgi:hypothetical protein